MKNITPEELDERLHDDDTDEVLIDVRTESEYKGDHIEGAKNIPLDDIEEAANHLKGIGNVYVTCGTGVRSQKACEELSARGINVINVRGGVQAWEKDGLKTVHDGKKKLPLIRQVMLVAGSLVFVGTVLGFVINQYWFIIPLFIGTGLTFAGFSGICPMAMILEKMPWNK